MRLREFHSPCLLPVALLILRQPTHYLLYDSGAWSVLRLLTALADPRHLAGPSSSRVAYLGLQLEGFIVWRMTHPSKDLPERWPLEIPVSRSVKTRETSVERTVRVHKDSDLFTLEGRPGLGGGDYEGGSGGGMGHRGIPDA